MKRSALFAAAVAVAFSTAATAQVAWTTWRNDDFRFQVEMPGMPVQTGGTSGPNGVLKTLMGQVSLGARGSIAVTAIDLSAVQAELNPDTVLEGGVQGAVNNAHATLDSETTIHVGGAVGRDFTSHTANSVMRSRALYLNKRVYAVFSAVPAGSAPLPEYDRVIASLSILP